MLPPVNSVDRGLHRPLGAVNVVRVPSFGPVALPSESFVWDRQTPDSAHSVEVRADGGCGKHSNTPAGPDTMSRHQCGST